MEERIQLIADRNIELRNSDVINIDYLEETESGESRMIMRMTLKLFD